MSHDRVRFAGAAALLLATGLLLVAMSLYPGGSLRDPGAVGFDFFGNYFCDLIAPLAKNGGDNRAAMWCARASMVLTGVAFVPLWLALPRRWPGDRICSWARPAGVVAAMSMPLVACTPSQSWSILHSIAILAAGAPGMLALVAAARCSHRERAERPRTALAAAAMVTTAVVVALMWSATFVTTWPDAWVLPTAQRFAWIALVGWGVAALRGRS